MKRDGSTNQSPRFNNTDNRKITTIITKYNNSPTLNK